MKKNKKKKNKNPTNKRKFDMFYAKIKLYR